MRNIVRYTITFTLLLAVQSCSREESVFHLFEEGAHVNVSLGYFSSENTVMTRAAASSENEDRIDNIYLFVFNSSGQKQPLTESNDSDVPRSNLFSVGNGLNQTNNRSGYLRFGCGTLTKATIVAIANVNDGATVNTAYDVDVADLDAIETLDDLKSYVMNLEPRSIGRGALFMMTGYAENTDGSTSIDIAGTESSDGDIDLTCNLNLRRTDAKVEITVTSDGSDKTNFAFRPLTWRVVRVPSKSLILPSDDGTDAPAEDETYFDTEPEEFEELSMDQTTGGGSVASSYTGSFVFYMPENLKKPDKYITEGGDEGYKLREKWVTSDDIPDRDPSKPGYTHDNLSFEYAPLNSTYLEITGQLSYEEGSTFVSSTSTYYVHLGGFNEDNPENFDPNDYKTKRNHHYRYTITVKGIDDVHTEVTVIGQDPRPGHEGDIVFNERGFYDLNCHYEQRLLSFPKSAFEPDEDGNYNLWWGVSTEFSNGVHEIGTEIPSEMRDYRWIKFAVNKLYRCSDNEMVRYPGDQNYNDPFPPDASQNDENSYADGGVRLMDVDQLMTYLKEEADKGDGGVFGNSAEIGVTAFIDEYLYVYDPKSDNPTIEPAKWWKESVNKQDRMMHIILEEADYSADGNSSVVKSMFTFRQKSIRTIYNTESTVPSGWGLESIMDSDSDTRLPVAEDFPKTGAYSEDNGRANTISYLNNKRENNNGELRWSEVLTTDENGEIILADAYNNHMYACLMRNRDLNGDDIVDDNEIRWYIASINQLTDLFIGEFALDYESRLYPYDPVHGNPPPGGSLDRPYWHYASSTYGGSYSTGWWPWKETFYYPVVLWAEEGASKGGFTGELGSKNLNGSNYAYRCVRNLGLPLDSDEIPEDFVQTSSDFLTFDLSYLDPKALRDYYVQGAGEIPSHDEKSANSLPWKKFSMTQSYRGIGGGAANWDAYQNPENNPWRHDEYRLPNLRELLIFTSRRDLEKISGVPHIMSCTGFSMRGKGRYAPPYNDENPDRKVYTYNTDGKTLGPGDNSGWVYGVHDIL